MFAVFWALLDPFWAWIRYQGRVFDFGLVVCVWLEHKGTINLERALQRPEGIRGISKLVLPPDAVSAQPKTGSNRAQNMAKFFNYSKMANDRFLMDSATFWMDFGTSKFSIFVGPVVDPWTPYLLPNYFKQYKKNMGTSLKNMNFGYPGPRNFRIFWKSCVPNIWAFEISKFEIWKDLKIWRFEILKIWNFDSHIAT